MTDLPVREWQGCPLTNPMTPEDICWLPRGHSENHHLMTMQDALTDEQQANWERYRDDSLMGLEEVIRAGRRQAAELRKHDTGENWIPAIDGML